MPWVDRKTKNGFTETMNGTCRKEKVSRFIFQSAEPEEPGPVQPIRKKLHPSLHLARGALPSHNPMKHIHFSFGYLTQSLKDPKLNIRLQMHFFQAHEKMQEWDQQADTGLCAEQAAPAQPP